MERLTTNKSVADMSMIELAHNSCYADDERNARYRDYNLDVDSRWLVRNLAKDICGEDFMALSDEEVDEYMASMLSVGIDSTIGLLALFYRNLWAMADLREKLKYYEDAEEQGLLLRFPCKVGDILYFAHHDRVIPSEILSVKYHVEAENHGVFIRKRLTIDVEGVSTEIDFCEIGKTVFLTETEAEAKLKEMEKGNGAHNK